MDENIYAAKMQFVGFAHASKGYSINDLAHGMGLTKPEWKILRSDSNIVSSLRPSDKIELDKMFGLL